MKKLLMVLMLSVVMMSSVSAAGYLKIGDIKGESTDSDHKEWIVIDSFSQSMQRAESSVGGPVRGRVDVEDIQVTKELDKSSPKLQEALVTGVVFPMVELELTTPGRGGQNIPYYQYELENVIVTSYSVAANAEGVPTETFSLNYEEIKVTYSEIDEKSGIASIVEWIYNLMTNE